MSNDNSQVIMSKKARKNAKRHERRCEKNRTRMTNFINNQLDIAAKSEPHNIETLSDFKIMIAAQLNSQSQLHSHLNINKKILRDIKCSSNSMGYCFNREAFSKLLYNLYPLPDIMGFQHTRNTFAKLIYDANYVQLPCELIQIIVAYTQTPFNEGIHTYTKYQLNERWYSNDNIYSIDYDSRYDSSSKYFDPQYKLKMRESHTIENVHNIKQHGDHDMMVITPCCCKLMCHLCFLYEVENFHHVSNFHLVRFSELRCDLCYKKQVLYNSYSDSDYGCDCSCCEGDDY